MTGRELQVLEHVAFIHKDMVDTHQIEVHHVVLRITDSVQKSVNLRLQVTLPALQTLLYAATVAPVPAFHSVHRIFQLLHFVLHHFQFDVLTLRNTTELVVTHNHTVPVVVLHLVEEVHTLLGRVVLGTGIQHLGLRIGGAIRFCNGTHVCLQANNHRLVNQS